MKTTAAFRALTQNRITRTLDAKPFVVRSVNKDGTLSGAAVLPMNYAATAEEAEAVLNRLTTLNPGRKFAVCANS